MPDTVMFAFSVHSEGAVSCDGAACPADCPVCNPKENQS